MNLQNLKKNKRLKKLKLLAPKAAATMSNLKLRLKKPKMRRMLTKKVSEGQLKILDRSKSPKWVKKLMALNANMSPCL